MSEDIVHTKLQEEIQKFADVPKIMNFLKSRGHLQFLQSRLTDILASELEADPERATSVKESIKVIINAMIDQIWGSLTSKSYTPSNPPTQLQQCQPDYENSDATTLELPQGLMDKVEERRNSLKQTKQNVRKLKHAASLSSRPRHSSSMSGNFSPTISKATQKTIQEKSYSKSYFEMNSFSEFNNISGPASFSRAPKESVDREKSPGPAAYMFDELKYRARSPRICIPKAAKKELFLSESKTPSPNLYYPSKHFVSRY